MAFLIGILTFIMVITCLVLIFLVLIQLPKKEAGAGVAFGGAATDALFGAGSGNVLTKVTKYSAATFFVLALILSLLQSSMYHRADREFKKGLNDQMNQPVGQPAAPAAATPAAPAPAATPAPSAATSSNAATAK